MDWQTRAEQRDSKLAKRRKQGMVETSRSIKSVIIPTIARKGRDAAKKLRSDRDVARRQTDEA